MENTHGGAAGMTDFETKQSIIDDEHLRLLSLGYLISAVITGLFSLLGLLYAFIGIAMGAAFSSGAIQDASEAPPEMVGWMFGIFGGLFFLFAAGLAIAKYLTASFLKKHKSPMFCMVVAGISCLSIPYGTLLGISTFLVLNRPSVYQLFRRTDPV